VWWGVASWGVVSWGVDVQALDLVLHTKCSTISYITWVKYSRWSGRIAAFEHMARQHARNALGETVNAWEALDEVVFILLTVVVAPHVDFLQIYTWASRFAFCIVILTAKARVGSWIVIHHFVGLDSFLRLEL
jgi:hypothetical protein